MRLFYTTILLLVTISIASGQDISRQNAQKKKIQEEIAYIDKQLSSTKSKQKKSINALNLTQKKIERRKEMIKALDEEIRRYDRQISQKEREIGGLERRLDTLELYHSNLVYNAYKHRDAKIWFMYILSSDNLGQGLRRWSYLQNLSNEVAIQAAQIRELHTKLNREKSELRLLRIQAINSQKERETEYKTLSKEETQMVNTLNILKKDEKRFKEELTKKRKEIERLNKEIERILAEAVREQKRGGKTVKIDYELSSKFSDNKGKLPWPVEKGVITEKYGQSYHPVFKTVKLPFNNGINISTDKNGKALSVFDGVVKQILVMPGYNQCVLIQHGEYFTFYCKLKRVDVSTGAKIKLGDVVGIVDDNEDGNGTLHFQLWKGTTKQNPELWLRKR